MANIINGTPTVKLNDGASIPVLGYGTGTAWFKRGDGPGEVDRTLIESVKTAIKLGWHHLDGAEVYGTEPELGIAIKESGVPREKLFVTSKVVKNISNIPNAIDLTLEKLQLDYLDLYLIHSPFFAKSDKELKDAWAEMEKLKDSGKVRSIGVSNYLQSHLEATLKTVRITPAINQIEFHPYLQHGNLIAFHEENGITTSAYGPLTPIARAKGGPLDGLLATLANKYAVSEGEILLRWSIDRGAVTITTSGKESRLTEYMRALTFSLTPREVDEISDLGEQKHYRAFWTEKFRPEDRS